MLSFIFIIFWSAVILLLTLASFNATLGLRQKYVEILLKIFEFGRIKIEKAEKRLNIEPIEPESSDIYHSVINKEIHSGPLPSQFTVGPLSSPPNLTVSPPSSHLTVSLSPSHLTVSPSPSQLTVDFGLRRNRSYNTLKREFNLWDVADFIKSGVEAIIEDDVTKRFSAEELPSWNLLTRTNKNYAFVSVRLSILWGLGWTLRYCILLPSRIFITIIGVGWLLICTSIIGYIPEGRFKRWLYSRASLMCFRIMARSFSAIVTYHNKENKAKGGGICVANHTSPIDVVILACDNCYALVGQRHPGFLGLLQRSLNRATSHIWFERFEMKDRASVTNRLKEHCGDSEKLPILIFPEGTCINNTSVMMFKKGSFEVGGTIYPAAIKYDSRFGDPFWNSSKQGYVHYLFMMMSSWAIVCDVWYLPPMTRKEGENAIDFSKRVKAVIARQGGFLDLEWDGQLKRMQVKKEWKELQQQEYSKKIIGE